MSFTSFPNNPTRLTFRLVLWVAILCGDLATAAHAQESSPDVLATKLAKACRKHDVPALAAAVVNKDGLVESACFGLRKRGSNDKVVMSDRFPIGSNTKSMTATLAAVLVESGKIDWKTSIGEVWPKATDADIHPDMRAVTLDELLSHQSGLPANISGLAWLGFFNEKRSPELERKRMLKLVLSKPPTNKQKKFSYSNLGYVVVAAMLEARAKASFESLAKKHIFNPLEMDSAAFRSLESAKKTKPSFLWGHEAKQGKPFDPRLAGAENPTVYASCGTVHLTIEDYAKYARWQLLGEPAPVLRTQAAFDHLREPLVDYDDSGAKYAGGWIVLDSGLGPALNHAGSNTKAFALIWILPESDVAAVVCTNTGQPQAFAACDEIMGHLLVTHAAAKPKGKKD